jgi:prevent-host-death family protein
MTDAVNIHEAKTRLSALIARVCKGETIIIAKAGKPVVKLVPIVNDDRPREPGRFKGKITMAPDFTKTPDDIIAAFEGDRV